MNTELSPMGAIDEDDRKSNQPRLFTFGIWAIGAGLVLSVLGMLKHFNEMQYGLTRDYDALGAAHIAIGVGVWFQVVGLLMVLAGCVVSAIRENR